MKRVLFLCIGNSCRSQMAEGFARCYGGDVIEASSAGLAPAPIVQPATYQVMLEKNITLENQFPKDLSMVDVAGLDLIVNMSGSKLPSAVTAEVRDWKVADPIGKSESLYREVRDQIEDLVMRLVLELRRQKRSPAEPAAPGSGATRPRTV